MTDPYKITKQIRIYHKEDEWHFVLTTDDYGTVTVVCAGSLKETTGKTNFILIPKDCIPHFVNALEELYDRT